jgi:hypothetical protein
VPGVESAVAHGEGTEARHPAALPSTLSLSVSVSSRLPSGDLASGTAAELTAVANAQQR